MRRLSDRFAQSANACSSLDALHALLGEVSRDLGFRYFALLHHATLTGRTTGLIRLDNYPPAWRAELEQRGLARHDPVHFASRRRGSPFCWTDLDRLVELDARQQAVLERSRAFGLGCGFTVPANSLGEPAASCSFALDQWTELTDAQREGAAIAGAIAYEAARRIITPIAAPRRTRLSPRQVECLRLLADGKTDWEIARILGLRPETVRHYVKQARAAYDVISRGQLIRLGLRDGWIDF